MSLILKIIFWYCVFIFVRSLLRGRIRVQTFVHRGGPQGPFAKNPQSRPSERAKVGPEGVIEADYRVIKDS